MPLEGFEPTVSAGERAQTYALDRAATGTGYIFWKKNQHFINSTNFHPKCPDIFRIISLYFAIGFMNFIPTNKNPV